jgi:CO/xanthine dehydrogenase Mo-binding subunit
MIVGRLVRNAALQLQDRVVRVFGRFPHQRAAFEAAARRVCGRAAEVRFEVGYKKPDAIRWDDASYRGDAYEAYSYAAVAVDLEIDRDSFEVKLHRVTTAADIGTVVNPLLAEGQLIGGTTQALGYALLENAVYRDGVMQNSQLTNYIIPTAVDTPEIDVSFVPAPYSLGPFGAKGAGELPMDAPAPAVAAAVLNATGALIADLPILPEKIAAALGTRAPAAGPR